MGLIANIKAAFSNAAYLAASMREMSGIGNGPKPRPFNYDLAVREFHSWAYAAAMLNATAFASTPKRLYARQRSGVKSMYATKAVDKRTLKYLAGDRGIRPAHQVSVKVAEFGGDIVEVIEPHPALEVLRSVNANQNGYELEMLRSLDLQMTGNAYLLVVDGAFGVPGELWRMPPQWTKIVPDKTRFIGGYKYGSGGQEIDLRPDEVIHFRLPNPADLFYGKGWFEAAWKSLGLHDSKRNLDLSTFDNYARPDWLLTVPGGKQEAMDALETKLTNKFRQSGGKRENASFISLSADVKAQALNWQTPEVGTATRVIEEISAVSGVPVAMLLSNDPTRASSESARLGWYRNTIQPMCRLEEEKLNEKWLPLFDGSEDLFIAHDPANFEDLTAQGRRVAELVKAGVLDPNEGRAELGYPPHPDGDKLYAPIGATGGGVMEGTNNGNDQQQNN